MILRALFILVGLMIFPLMASAQCNYQLFASDSLGCENDLINFRIHPKPPVSTTVSWDFELKKVPNTNKPAVIFTRPDTFSVKATLLLPGGRTCELERSDYIVIGPKPVKGTVRASKKLICQRGDTATFIHSGNDEIERTWTIEADIFRDTSRVLQHTFSEAGTPTVQLLLRNKFGCTDKSIFDSLVYVREKPQVEFPYTDTMLCGSGKMPVNVSVKDKYKDLRYQWDFKGAVPRYFTTKEPDSVYYARKGVYSVSLYVFQINGSCSYSHQFDSMIRVSEAPPLELKSEKLSEDDCANNEYLFTFQPDYLDTNKIAWEIIPLGGVNYLDRRRDSLRLYFGEKGVYTIMLSYLQGSCTKKKTVQKKVDENELTPRIVPPDFCSCKVPDTVHFGNASSGNNGPFTYRWTIINGSSSSRKTIVGEEVDVIFDTASQYRIILEMIDTNGCSEYTITTHSVELLSVEIESGFNVACRETAIPLKMDVPCKDSMKSGVWYLYDEKGKLIDKRTGISAPDFVLPSDGLYTLKYELETARGCKAAGEFADYARATEIDSIGFKQEKPRWCKDDQIKVYYYVYPIGFASVIRAYLRDDNGTLDTAKINYEKRYVFFKPKKVGTYDLIIVADAGKCYDSLVVFDEVTVGRVSAQIKLDNRNGCIPLKTYAEAVNIDNLVYGESDTKLQYEWEIKPGTRGDVLQRSAKRTDIIINGAGPADVYLKITNSEGCKFEKTIQNAFNLNFKSAFGLSNKHCRDVPLKPINNSTGQIDRYRWSASPSTVQFIPNANVREPSIVFTQPGQYSVSLKISNDQCEDVITRSISIIDFHMEVSLLDSSPQCSPAAFEFKIASDNVDTFIWDFGDESAPAKTHQKEYLKVYDLSRLDSFRNYFDITLIGFNKEGCRDTIVREDWIHVRGPKAAFEIIDPVGCAPHRVRFRNKTEGETTFYFEYGDWSSADTAEINPHLYHLQNATDTYVVYRPFLVASDRHGCKIRSNTKDSIVVYRPPQPRFTLEQKGICSPAQIELSDQSGFVSRISWRSGNGQRLEDRKPGEKVSFSYPAGTYRAKLVAYNAIGCADSVQSVDFIVYQSPKADFKRESSVGCTGQEIWFESNAKSYYPLENYNWTLTDSLGGKYEFEGEKLNFVPSLQGPYSLQLIIIDSNGCTDTLLRDQYVRIYDSLPVKSPRLYSTSYWTRDKAAVIFEPASKLIFKNYLLYQDREFDSLYSYNRLDSLRIFTRAMLSDGPVCHHLSMIDRCRMAHPSDTHCTVHLRVDSQHLHHAFLKWTAYVGWDNQLEAYKLYRSKGNAYELLAELSPDQLEFHDSSVCDRSYHYFVEAVHEKDYRSQSNRVAFRPDYIYQDEPLDLRLATVRNDSLFVHWEPTKQLNIKQYVIDRKRPYAGWESEYAVSESDTFWIDPRANVHHGSYTYRIRVEDNCGNSSVPGPLASSIFLQAAWHNRVVELNWNRYREWEEGIAEQWLQRKGADEGAFSTLAKQNGSALSFRDTSAFLSQEAPFLYRLIAIRNSEDKRDSSYSQELLVVPPTTIFVPNAFTPNNDGINDVFRPRGVALDTSEGAYELKIFNRWGQLIYKGTKLDIGWNGRFKGPLCEAGLYIYRIECRELSGRELFLSGGVYLLR